MGIGLIPRGNRDFDAETGTFVITVYLCLLYLPIFPTGSYRVHSNRAGSVALGQEPVSGGAYALCFVVVLALLGAAGWAGWITYTQTPGYQAGQLLSEAQVNIASGEPGAAARRYEEVIRGFPDHHDQAVNGLADLLANGLKQASGAETAEAIAVGVVLNRGQTKLDVVDDLVGVAIDQSGRLKQTEPEFSLQILESVSVLEPDSPRLAAAIRPALSHLLEKTPDDLLVRSRLAEVYEADGDIEACLELLSPYASTLGETEGARILGQIFVAQGDIDGAYALLEPYTATKLRVLSQVEARYFERSDQAWEQAITALDQGEANDDWYRRYDRADEASQIAMVQEYGSQQLAANTDLEKLRLDVIDASQVVPVALELGVVKLHRARGLTDAEERQRELESAEQTLLAIAGFSEGDASYQLFLAQVHWWMGREDEANERFSALLAGHEDDPDMLVAVGGVLRLVGASGRARRLYEKAYELAPDQSYKHELASSLAAMANTNQDVLRWLRRGNQQNPMTRAALYTAEATEMVIAGDEQNAVRDFRRAIATYGELPDSTATLNNAALASQSLYAITADPADIRRAADLMRRAVELDPSNSILIVNASHTMLTSMAADLLGDVIDFKALEQGAELSHLGILYNDVHQRDQVIQRVKEHPMYARVLSLNERSRMVAPSAPGTYATAVGLANLVRDEALIHALVDDITRANIDHEESRFERAKWLAGERDETVREGLRAGAERARRVAESMSSDVSPRTRALALSTASEAYLSFYTLGDPIDVDAAVAFASQAKELAPSATVGSTWSTALVVRALYRHADADVGLRRMIERSRRDTSPIKLLAWIFSRDLTPAQRLADDPDVQAAVEHLVSDLDRYPEWNDVWEWAIMQPFDPDSAKVCAKNIVENKLNNSLQDVTQKLNLRTSSSIMEECWQAMITGDEARVASILAEAEVQGIRMP